uniref:Protein draper-like isoform X1 n=1 Tax=Crassostrea virginica TaxID=6565 RepID=A0A8B8BTF4_CRAVI|nr:protein draper-like isoform X1 [Crassostrea virginica]
MDAILQVLFFLQLVHTSISYEDLAFNKPTWLQVPYPHNPFKAEYAVDGNTKLCAISADTQSRAEWRVDLGGIFSVHHIYIHYRTDNLFWDETNPYTTRFLGFSVYLSNTTNKDDGILCFKDRGYTKATIPNPTNITCINHGRYLIYYNNRTHSPFPVGYSSYAFSELCEIQVYGCPTSSYGENCSLPCPENCQKQRCDIVEGRCLGCLTGYTGPRCDKKCKDNTYGMECTLVCGNCLNGEQCNHVNGSCPNGCAKGTHGDKCDKACPSDLYSYNCEEKCSTNCGNPAKCDRITGLCEGGCPIGWKTPTCKEKCDGRRYGQNCSKSCGSCFENEQCHFINGTCLNGCSNGYWGDGCEKNCAKSFIFESDDLSFVIYTLASVVLLCLVLIVVLVMKVRQLKILNQCIKRENRGKESPYSDVPDEGYDQLKEPPGYTNTNVRRSKLFRVLRQLPSTWELNNVKRY